MCVGRSSPRSNSRIELIGFFANDDLLPVQSRLQVQGVIEPARRDAVLLQVLRQSFRVIDQDAGSMRNNFAESVVPWQVDARAILEAFGVAILERFLSLDDLVDAIHSCEPECRLQFRDAEVSTEVFVDQRSGVAPAHVF